MQTLATHIWPLAQALPQAPQFAGSEVVFTHAVPHRVVLPLQLTAQAPDEQTCPLGQTFPHVPQFAGSV
jgi:hypothetical protein